MAAVDGVRWLGGELCIANVTSVDEIGQPELTDQITSKPHVRKEEYRLEPMGAKYDNRA